MTKVDLRDALFEVFDQLQRRDLFLEAWGEEFYGERVGYVGEPEKWVRDNLGDSSLWQYLDRPSTVTAEYDPETANYDKPKKWSLDVLVDIVELLHRDAVAVPGGGPDEYDQEAGRAIFRDAVNPVLAQLEPPLVLTEGGQVVEVATVDKTSIGDAIVQNPAPGGGTTPALTDEVYDHIVGIVGSLARAMEVTPTTYLKLDEEERRNVFLGALNTHYQDAAAGEAFNFGGKTDLLVRHGGDNVFIGECKIWRGPKTFTDALDQLFGYGAWRDTKLALIMFVPNQKMSEVLTEAKQLVEQHAQFVDWQNDPEKDHPLRARVHWKGDEGQHADPAIFLVHLPE